MAVKMASLLFLISMGLMVSFIQHVDSVPAQQAARASIGFCYGQMICGSECVVIPFMQICSCSGPCTDKELEKIMESGKNKTEAVEKMSQVI